MDIEGEEAKILKSSLEIFQKYRSVSILMEVHPHEYDGDEMYFALKGLFDIGFKASFVETAWVRAPRIIEEYFGSPFKFFFNLIKIFLSFLYNLLTSKSALNTG